MNISWFLVFISSFFLLSCVAEKEHHRSPASIDIDVDYYLNMLPTKKLRDAGKEYVRLIGLKSYTSNNLGQSNQGLAAYNWDLLQKNKCFNDLVSDFYYEIMKDSLSFLNRQKPFHNSVFNSIGKTIDNTSVEDGWLWKRAMKFSNGDPNLAMSLIGICGHDDTAQLPSEYNCKEIKEHNSVTQSCIAEPKYIAFKSAKQENSYLQMGDRFFNKIFALYQPTTVSAIEMKNKIMENQKETPYTGVRGKGMACPSGPIPFFVQGSLGRDTLLDSELIDEIVDIQAPTKGANFLPSKYYHTIGSAYATCSLVRGGVPGFIVRKIQTAGINSYRMFRLCEVIEDPTLSMASDGKTRNDLLVGARKSHSNPNYCKTTGSDGSKYYDYKFECQILNKLEPLIKEPDFEEALIKRKLDRIFAEREAAAILRNKILDGDKCRSVQLSTSNIDALKRYSDNPSSCKQLPDVNCRRAREVLKTWWVDFKWTEAQHRKGADFAIQNCESERDFIESGLEKKSCEALQTHS